MPSATAHAASPAQRRLLTLASGGWVLVITALMCVGIFAWAVTPAIIHHFARAPGDGKTIESYQFDLANLTIPREQIYTVTIHRDMVPVMFHPTSTGPTSISPTSTNPASNDVNDPRRWEKMQHASDPQYGKYLVHDDRVIGVEINGEARAYPISVMTVHEIANDVLGGVPIAVTYNWPCDSVVVFDRRVNGQTLEFNNSGLVWNSNLLMYDVHRDANGKQLIGGESLFNQLLARGVSGTYAGAKLTLIPSTLTSWRVWSQSHPQTSVLNRDLSMANRYPDSAPTSYFRSPEPLRPVTPTVPPPTSPNGPTAKTRVLAVNINGTRRVYPVPMIDRLADNTGRWNDDVNGVTLQFQIDRPSQTVTVTSLTSGANIQATPALWFAWHAMYPDDVLVAGAESSPTQN
jgi:hypothetical protein